MSTKSASRLSARTADAAGRKAVRIASRTKSATCNHTSSSSDNSSQLLKNRQIQLKRCMYDGKEVRKIDRCDVIFLCVVLIIVGVNEV